MLILSNLLALALVVADEPRPAPAPITAVNGAFTITYTPVAQGEVVAEEPRPAEPSPASSAMPKILKPHTGGDPVADEVWPLTLPEAIRIGLDNSEIIRVMPAGEGGNVEIAKVFADASTWKFKADVMAHVRSIEQTYWALSHQNITLWSRETALRLGEEILKRERAELEVGKGAQADVAEAEQQVENYKLNLASATADVITAERQLRNLLGLPPADGRRIVPSTAPTEARLEPDWEVSVREMTGSQPDIAQQDVIIRLAELQLLMARNQLLPLMGPEALHEFGKLGGRLEEVAPGLAELIRRDAARPYPAGMDPSEPREPEFIAGQVGLAPPTKLAEPPRPAPASPDVPVWESGGRFMSPIDIRAPLANTRQRQYQLLRERATQRQILHQATHSLARFFLEVDANYKQFRTAQRLRASAQQRLEAQRAFYEEGRITVDRLLDAVTQYTNAIAQESQYKASYNTSIAALEEAKGTLLAYDKIAVLDKPAASKADPSSKRDAIVVATFDGPAATAPTPASTAQPAPMTYKIKARLWGVKFLEVEVEASPTRTGP